MFFASDNAGPVHPKVMDRVIAANNAYQMPYGKDTIMDEVRLRIREVFEAPQAEVYLVATGTAANALALACYTQPWQTIFCSRVAHIEEDECNAPEFYAGAAKLTLIDTDDKMTPAALDAAIAKQTVGNVHGAQPGPVSITQVTERGSVHSLDELQALTAVAKAHDLPVHLDGARFANAMAALGCTAAEMSWKSGVDVVSFGGTKNGCMGVEAVIFFDPAKAWEFELRRKRGAHLFSKHRFLSAQMAGYLQDDAFVDIAQMANANATYLAEGLRKAGATFLHEPQANMIFASWPRAVHQKLHDAGARYYLWDGPLEGPADAPVAARLVCDWSIGHDQIDAFLSHF
ncbi:low specificity L-threonine aldolase [Sulfitobacter sp. M57]|uniref:threonine aldolase family protein n=1 Tax=unclassified Sulfitobacter TaxID=196795 RepID=UPI0023E20539|nr:MULTISPECIES: beta-eliminating lyase-related protein [unclassified Sulfitobacter]MDF3415607.1 low specificity L-threonine aldolase [Sulfitobacter sp. KE5]MDF3423087.1 low specificity L-threonine aldolase [Sulfitobacter sp. KE43]MDF3434153.1 low specificity L-threonine aldolase [Sulfitobacter sp. KE42]MDF3459814.1 low specificity L-threonine aldolase [Sulfitobacter sp. S74]MDF3463691.1 low specificity L-threonine aldolase [Sulfitobacter sp. Ks18]